jgi:hypothetical protein
MLLRTRNSSLCIALAISAIFLAACGTCPQAPAGASISILAPARAAAGGTTETDEISGAVKGVTPASAQVVIYAHAGDRWWIQPFEDAPFTAITPKLEWTSRTHFGFEYAALLVSRSYSPPKQPRQLPQIGGCVWAVDTAKGHN